MTHVHTRLRTIVRILTPWALALTCSLQAAAQTTDAAQPPETSAVMYPMFFIGNPDAAKHHIEFMWTPSDATSAAIFQDIITPLLPQTANTLAINLYLVAEQDEDDDVLDGQLGALLTCVPPEQMPQFAFEILGHNQEDDDVRDLAELFEVSKTFGNTSATIRDCVEPTIVATILATSETIKTAAKIHAFPALFIDGVLQHNLSSLDAVLPLLK